MPRKMDVAITTSTGKSHDFEPPPDELRAQDKGCERKPTAGEGKDTGVEGKDTGGRGEGHRGSSRMPTSRKPQDAEFEGIAQGWLFAADGLWRGDTTLAAVGHRG